MYQHFVLGLYQIASDGEDLTPHKHRRFWDFLDLFGSLWWICPLCPRRVRFLFGGRIGISSPYRIACAKCQRIAYGSDLEGKTRRWRRQLDKTERRLGGDPRKLTPPKGNARRTFDRLARRHAYYMAKVIAHAQERLHRKLRKKPWLRDPAEMQALRQACGLPGPAA